MPIDRSFVYSGRVMLPLLNLRLRRWAALLALAATLTGQAVVAHGHGGESDRLAGIAAASESPHEAGDCAACAAQATRHWQLTARSVSVLPVPPPQRIAPAAPERAAPVAPPSGLPRERAPPHSA